MKIEALPTVQAGYSDVPPDELACGTWDYSERRKGKIVYARPEAIESGLDPKFEDQPLVMTGRFLNHVPHLPERLQGTVWQVQTLEPPTQTLFVARLFPENLLTGQEMIEYWQRAGALGVYADRPDSPELARALRQQEEAQRRSLMPETDQDAA